MKQKNQATAFGAQSSKTAKSELEPHHDASAFASVIPAVPSVIPAKAGIHCLNTDIRNSIWAMTLSFCLVLIMPVQAAAPCVQMPILKPVEPVVLMGNQLQLRVSARIDTGAEMSSLDSVLAKRLGLDQNIIGEITVRNAHGTSRRKVVRLKYLLKGQMRSSDFSLIPRQGLGQPVLVGRRSLKGFLVDPGAECDDC